MWLRSSTVIAVGVILLVSCCDIGESQGGGGGSRGAGGGGAPSVGSEDWFGNMILLIVNSALLICICGGLCYCFCDGKKPAKDTVTPTQVSTIAERDMFSGAGIQDMNPQPPPYTTDSGARGAHHLSHTDIQPPPQYSANGYHTRPPPYKVRDPSVIIKLTSPRTHGVPPSRHEH